MRSLSRLSLVTITGIVTACGGADSSGGLAPEGALLGSNGGGSVSTTAIALRVKCELRVGRRSKISVDGNNLAPLNAMWSARVASGGRTAAAPARQGVGDEVDFDFDSNPRDIAAGATPIAAGFIGINSGGADVTAELVSASGMVVATGGAECSVR